MTTRRPRPTGFTLIEILIVVVILGILAAVIIPQFTNASEDASVSTARMQWQTMRSQIELYRAQSGGGIPPPMVQQPDPILMSMEPRISGGI